MLNIDFFRKIEELKNKLEADNDKTYLTLDEYQHYNSAYWKLRELMNLAGEGRDMYGKKIEELPEEKWTIEGDEQYIQCPSCKSSEGLPVEEQRHHLTTTFTVKSEDVSNMIIECECGKVFKTKK